MRDRRTDAKSSHRCEVAAPTPAGRRCTDAKPSRRPACYTRCVGEILIGTSGYSYDDWVGPVYPEGTHRSDFLGIYAHRFRFTELNFSYYRQPTPDGLRSIAAKTPPRFRFTVKAYRALTHDRATDWQREAERFAEAVRACPRAMDALTILMADRSPGVFLLSEIASRSPCT